MVGRFLNFRTDSSIQTENRVTTENIKLEYIFRLFNNYVLIHIWFVLAEHMFSKHRPLELYKSSTLWLGCLPFPSDISRVEMNITSMIQALSIRKGLSVH